MERYFNLYNIIKFYLKLLNSLTLHPKIKCFSEKKNQVNAYHKNPLIQLYLKMESPKALLMQTLTLPPFISSFSPLPSVCLAFSSTMPIPPGCSLALRYLLLIRFRTTQDMFQVFFTSSSPIFPTAPPLVYFGHLAFSNIICQSDNMPICFYLSIFNKIIFYFIVLYYT